MKMPTDMPAPLLLLILDGWGMNPRWEGNAIAQARTPNMDRLWAEYPHATLEAAGEAVGLPKGQMGNSEVGHLNLGAGMIVVQDSLRIDGAIADGSFFQNEKLLSAVQYAKKNHSNLHLMGLLGPGGVHSYSRHLYVLLKLAKDSGLERVFIHAFLDGRDTLPRSALGYMEELEAKIKELGVGQVASIGGRYYAMDRDNRWQRVRKAYEALVLGEGERAPSSLEAIRRSYQQGVSDEFVLPTVISQDGGPLAILKERDAAIFFNFRADRTRQLTRALISPNFTHFRRRRFVRGLHLVTMTQYDDDFPLPVAFESLEIPHPLAEVLSCRGLRQFHTAETEKYAHVTFFFNGGREDPFPGEERLLVPSPKVPTYDLQPEMSAWEVTEVVLKRIRERRHQVIIVNYANCDMVGHTGVMAAAIKAAETADACVGKVMEAALEAGGVVIITADHGNAEQMIDYETGTPFTAHTTDPVPCILVASDQLKERRFLAMKPKGVLADVAPTILELLGIPKPPSMTGRSLLVHP